MKTIKTIAQNKNSSYGYILILVLQILLLPYQSQLYADTFVISTDSTIVPGDNSFDGHDITISSATVTISGFHRFNSLTLMQNAVLTHSEEAPDKLVLEVGKVAIEEGSAIDVSCLGRQAEGVTGYSGGSYGGNGIGWGGGETNPSYGDYREPDSYGTGGRDANGNYRGGGAVKLIADELMLNGSINANGGASDLRRPMCGGSSGGSSGGSIWLDLGTISGAGLISANGGGMGTNLDNTVLTSGAGSGGRIAIHYATNNNFVFTGKWGNPSSVEARGGSGNLDSQELWAGAGTIYLRDKTTDNETLHIRNEYQSFVDENGSGDSGTEISGYFPGNLIVGGGASWASGARVILKGDITLKVLEVNGQSILEHAGKLTITDRYLLVRSELEPTLICNGMFVPPGTQLSFENATVILNADQTTWKDITISLARFTINVPQTSWQNIIVENGTMEINAPQTWQSLKLSGSSRLTYGAPKPGFPPNLMLTLDTLSIDENATIDVRGTGLQSSAVTGNSGGSYGGLGGESNGKTNVIFGDEYAPVDVGTGGPGLAGAGAVKIIARNLTLNGEIIADGSDSSSGPGGSSGGSVWLEVHALDGSGSIRANGGVGKAAGIAGGGGGRIALYYDIPDFGVVATVQGGAGGNGLDGQNGTVYLEGPLTVATTLPKKNALAASNLQTIAVIFSANIDAATFTVDDAILTGPNDDVVGITTVERVAPDSFNLGLAKPLKEPGTYTLKIGPDIRSITGRAMDVNRNGVRGEANADVFAMSFRVRPNPPVVTNYPMAPDSTDLNIAKVTIEGTRDDNTSIFIDGTKQVDMGSGPWSAEVSLRQGNNEINIQTGDSNANLSDAVIVILRADLAPAAVTIIADGNGNGVSAVLNWANYDASSHPQPIDHFTIYLSDSTFSNIKDASNVGTQGIASSSYQVDSLVRATTYYVAVTATDSLGYERQEVNAIAIVTKDVVPPENVQNLRIDSAATSLGLHWQQQAQANDTASFRIYVDNALTTTLSVSTPEYDLTGLQAATGYPVRIAAVDNDGNENYGLAVLAATLLPNPSNVVAEPSNNMVSLQWDAVTPGNLVASYNLYVSSSPFDNVTGMQPMRTIAAAAATGLISGLNNNNTYYFAVTTKNISGGERKQVVTVAMKPQADNTGPEIQRVTLAGATITAGATLEYSGLLQVFANDPMGVTSVVFAVDGKVIETDSQTQDGFQAMLDIEAQIDGAHTLTFTALDSLNNQSAMTMPVELALAAPVAPTITAPANGSRISASSASITGKTDAKRDVLLFRNNEQQNVVIADTSGSFQTTMDLLDGDNSLQVAARNRAGIGSRSGITLITVDVHIPSPPTGVAARSMAGGSVLVSWNKLAETAITYDVYRATTPFTAIGDAQKINQEKLYQTSFDDLPNNDGHYYYRIVAVSAAGINSVISAQVQADSDREAPRALAIDYETNGGYDVNTGRMASGFVQVKVRLTEELLTLPFLTIKPDGGTPIAVTLRRASDTEYTGDFEITQSTKTGTAYAILSMRDKVGNRGSDIGSGESIEIDTAGPQVVKLTTTPSDPIKNSQTAPPTIHARLELSEAVTGTPSLSYQWPNGATAIPIMALQQVEVLVWEASFTLDGNIALNAAENITFDWQAKDDLGNESDRILAGKSVQIYQGELPPLKVPTGLVAKALPNGGVTLAWHEVIDAAEYQVYRQSPADSSLMALTRTIDTKDFRDEGLTDGVYNYAVASIRSQNNEEAISGLSNIVEINADSQPADAPSQLTLKLTGSGIQANWQAPGETATFNLYRSSALEILSVDGLTPYQTDIKPNQFLDSTPSEEQHTYVVTALDAAGNESEPSNSVYLNFDLLPVQSLVLTQADDDSPELVWTYPGKAAEGFDVYLQTAVDTTKLNPTPLGSPRYTDSGFAGDERNFIIVAVDNNGKQSPGRAISLPAVAFAPAADNLIMRGIFSELLLNVRNNSAKQVDALRFSVEMGGQQHLSASFELAPQEVRDVAVIVGGYPELKDLSDVLITLERNTATAERTRIIRTFQVEVGDSGLVADLETDNFVSGGTGKARFRLKNTGQAELALITASRQGNQPSPDISLKLMDQDDNVLTITAMQQAVGTAVKTIASGETVALIAPGQSFVSDWMVVPVPANAPDQLFLKLQITNVHHQLGTDAHVSLVGPIARRAVNTVETPYSGTVESITPAESFGDRPIIITGSAIDRATQQPMADVVLDLVLTVAGFEKKFAVHTDATGTYSYTFTPLPEESGVYKVSCVHPGITDRPEQKQFVIGKVLVSPQKYVLKNPRNNAWDIPIKVKTLAGTGIHNLQLRYAAADQADAKFADGIHIKLPPVVATLAKNSVVELPINIWGDNNAPAFGNLVFQVVSDESGLIAKILVEYEFVEAKPALTFSPNLIETGVVSGDAGITEKVILENKGFAPLENVALRLLTEQDNPAPGWIVINSRKTPGTLEVGAKEEVSIGIKADQTVAQTSHIFKLQVTSNAIPVADIYIFVAVVQAGNGNALLHVIDIYTGTKSKDANGQDILDNNGAPIFIQGVEDARIKVWNDDVENWQDAALNLNAAGNTDANGDLELQNLSAGRYRYRVSKLNHTDTTGSFQIKPGITVSALIYLDMPLITVEWKVVEIPLEDRYEIVLEATYETNVPAAVVVAEPPNVRLPEMQPGDVYQGEFTLTNYGLIPAEEIKMRVPPDDEYFRYEYLIELPDVLEAKQRITAYLIG